MFSLICGVWFVCYSANSVVAVTEQTYVQNAASCPVAETQCGKPMDCAEIRVRDASRGETSLSGIYQIWPRGLIVAKKFDGPVDVYCDMDDDGGGWTVIQRRGDFGLPQDFFYKDWAAYKKGFGYLLKEFWLGNDIIFALTNQRSNMAKFSLSDWENNQTYAIYDEFWIEDEYRLYTMHVEGYRGTAGDSFSYHDKTPFSTHDRDNDSASGKNCADKRKGAWWFQHCQESHLNGDYLKGPQKSSDHGVIWHHFRGSKYSLKDTIIKIRPKDVKSILTNITPQ